MIFSYPVAPSIFRMLATGYPETFLGNPLAIVTAIVARREEASRCCETKVAMPKLFSTWDSWMRGAVAFMNFSLIPHFYTKRLETKNPV